ncbi:two-component sensor histidine kinase [Terrabacter tumescens]|uniref:histidine kinase n=1 Tax=Terrabacter tumescens TaxID=60443 RepID=A0ABQ2IEI2_9MICO|nr:histidine kinase [Terrabacter tumescens]GGN06016.1 two-component sensor histidine kinase [Terrabacter tumescens]
MPLPRIARTRRGHVWGESWRLGVGFLFGLAIWGVVQAQLDQRGVDPTFGKDWLLVDLALGVGSTVLLLWRRRWPLAVALVTTVLSGVSSVSVGASLVALVSLSTRQRWREIAVVAVPWMLAGVSHSLVYPTEPEAITLPNIIIGLLTLAVGVSIGWAVGERRAFVASLHDRALTAEREQAMRVVQAQVAERARIAREMHDVLAHRISLVAMHSGALAYRTDLAPEQVAETAEIVRESANQALTELRAVLGVLRDVPGAGASEDGSPEAPQPTLGDLDALVAEARSGGATVLLDRAGDLDAVPEQVSRSAYRIVQEGLTNARKHAPGAAVRVTVSTAPERGLDDEAVQVTVRNAVPRGGTDAADGIRRAPTVGAGLGLLGLTERAVLAGGELTYGPDRAGDFVLTARLPWSR